MVMVYYSVFLHNENLRLQITKTIELHQRKVTAIKNKKNKAAKPNDMKALRLITLSP